MKYYSDKLKKLFDTEEAIFSTEEAADKEKNEARGIESEWAAKSTE